MKLLLRFVLLIALLLMGFAAGFLTGQRRGFSTGSEWALVQAGILVREAGLFMPVNFEAGQFRVILKQPEHLYRTSWMLADRHEDDMEYRCSEERTLNEHMRLTRNASLLQ